MEPLNRMKSRLDMAREDSDVALFHELMYLGELVAKLAVAGLVAGVETEKDRHRYRLEYRLVRANGLGDWSATLDEVLTGTASQHLAPAVRPLQKQLTERVTSDDDWRFQAVAYIRQACQLRDVDYAAVPSRPMLRTWFADFAWLRNHARGHGAPTPGACSRLCPPLETAIGGVVQNLGLFQCSWAFLRRNLSGKYRVIRIAGDCEEFAYLKSDSRPTFLDGTYVWFDEPRRVNLVVTDVDLSDFYMPNGGFKAAEFELLSYITDQRSSGDSTLYRDPPTPLPESETRALGTLEVQGRVFGNLPPGIPDYVERPALEHELKAVLENDRHPVVSLVGRGGIGKTSLALHVLHELAKFERFGAILWFSARDIDLLSEGPKLVRADVLTDRDMAVQLVELLDPAEQDQGGFDSVDYLHTVLSRSPVGPLLFVLDNFETVRNPADLYASLDAYIRNPNKILITTRLRDFKADYPVEVSGMLEAEFSELVRTTASRLGISHALTRAYEHDLYQESDGHPYVAKVMLGEVATAGSPVKAQRVMAGRDDILDALLNARTRNFPRSLNASS